jgi:hypothetical protein
LVLHSFRARPTQATPPVCLTIKVQATYAYIVWAAKFSNAGFLDWPITSPPLYSRGVAVVPGVVPTRAAIERESAGTGSGPASRWQRVRTRRVVLTRTRTRTCKILPVGLPVPACG